MLNFKVPHAKLLKVLHVKLELVTKQTTEARNFTRAVTHLHLNTSDITSGLCCLFRYTKMQLRNLVNILLSSV